MINSIKRSLDYFPFSQRVGTGKSRENKFNTIGFKYYCDCHRIPLVRDGYYFGKQLRGRNVKTIWIVLRNLIFRGSAEYAFVFSHIVLDKSLSHIQ